MEYSSINMPPSGSIRFNTDTSKLEICTGIGTTSLDIKWWEVDSTPGTNAPRGILAGNYPANRDTIDYIQINTTGNAQDFGNLATETSAAAAMASSTRMIFAGGYIPGTITNEIQYIETTSTGNAVDWGSNISSTAKRKQSAGLADKTRGVYAGGFWPAARNEIEYVTIAHKGTKHDFGDLLSAKRYPMGCSSPTRGLIITGSAHPGSPATTNEIEFITIQSTGNSRDFGDINNSCRYGGAAAANSTRALYAGGYTPTNINNIDLIIISTQGNATNFGDLRQGEHGGTGMSSGTRAVFGGMYDGSTTNELTYVTITTLGDGLDFGDQTISAYYRSGGSNTHGGLG